MFRYARRLEWYGQTLFPYAVESHWPSIAPLACQFWLASVALGCFVERLETDITAMRWQALAAAYAGSPIIDDPPEFALTMGHTGATGMSPGELGGS
jgi:hypothetical protein